MPLWFTVAFRLLLLPTRTRAVELSTGDLHTNNVSTVSELCSLQNWFYSTDIVYFEYTGVLYMFLPLDVHNFSHFAHKTVVSIIAQ